jgi:hypothetical protein
VREAAFAAGARAAGDDGRADDALAHPEGEVVARWAVARLDAFDDADEEVAERAAVRELAPCGGAVWSGDSKTQRTDQGLAGRGLGVAHVLGEDGSSIN